jgi:pimeloyl-ACP methyl ester carboxylesterase
VEAVPAPRAVVGHSLGGAVALELARRRPELVDGLVLVATGARLPVPEWVMESLRADFAAECERVIAGSFVAGPSRAADRAREAMHAAGPATLEADYAACAGWDARGALGEVRAPALVIAGGEDRLTPPWLQEELTRELPLAQMALVPGAGHAVMAEAAGAVNLLIAAYLARLELTLDGL